MGRSVDALGQMYAAAAQMMSSPRVGPYRFISRLRPLRSLQCIVGQDTRQARPSSADRTRLVQAACLTGCRTRPPWGFRNPPFPHIHTPPPNPTPRRPLARSHARTHAHAAPPRFHTNACAGIEHLTPPKSSTLSPCALHSTTNPSTHTCAPSTGAIPPLSLPPDWRCDLVQRLPVR